MVVDTSHRFHQWYFSIAGLNDNDKFDVEVLVGFFNGNQAPVPLPNSTLDQNLEDYDWNCS